MNTDDRIWLQHYPAGVPADIDPDAYPSLAALLDDAFRRHGQRVAFTCMGSSLTYANLDRDSRALAAWMHADGIRPGDRVAVMLPNVLQYPVAMCAILRLGAILVNVNPLYTAHELSHQLRDAGAKTLFVLENFAHVAAGAIPGSAVQRIVICRMGDMFGGPKRWLVNAVVKHVRKLVPPYRLPAGVAMDYPIALSRGRQSSAPTPSISGNDIAVLQYTGGTTGVAKGAMLSHRNLVANTLQSSVWYSVAVDDLPADAVLLTVAALPLYHIYAFTCCAMLSMYRGGCCLLIPNPRDIPGLIKSLTGVAFHVLPGVNTLFNALANHPAFQALDFSHLRIASGGGAAVQAAVAEHWHQVTGTTICEGYGLSETSPVVTGNPLNATCFSGNIGYPVPSTRVQIIDEAGNALATGQVGEIAVKGPQVMLGYWQRPDETARVMTPTGYLRTGDIGIMDATGAIRIVDRKKDMILVSGFNVYPNEVEDVVAMHPDVVECAVVGVPSQNTGEAVKLFVVSRSDTLSTTDLQEHCHRNLAPYKCPKQIEFRADLPKSNVGKILRRQLRDQGHESH